jgi:DNA-binding Lrp family transcriptional regulator
VPIDAVDRQILAELQQDGRLTVTELAARVNLSISPCHRRLRDLERDGAIRGYRAVVDPAAVGLNFEALVFATVHWENESTVADFERAVAAIPHVLQAQASPTTCCASRRRIYLRTNGSTTRSW